MSKAPPHILYRIIKSVSHSAGVYLMKDKDGVPLYVGKASDLRKRLASYVRAIGEPASKTGVMLSKAASIETILTETEKEALILESSLIKRHRPPYNVILRDDKSYPYIKVTVQEKWPRLVVTRRKINDKAKYFGPFSSAGAMWQSVRYLNNLFPLRRCKGQELMARKRPCLNYQMQRCLSPCTGKVTHDEYLESVSDLIAVLSGQNKELVAKLKKRMKEAAEALDFEKAAGLRDKIVALQNTLEKQIVVSSHQKDQDVFAMERRDDLVAVSVIRLRAGVLNGHHSYLLPGPIEDDTQLLTELLERFYTAGHAVPKEILTPWAPANLDFLAGWLAELRQEKVSIKNPQRGTSHKLLVMAQKNAREVFAEKELKDQSWLKRSLELQKRLHLKRAPETIACMDISHTSGRQTVGAVVTFRAGDKESLNYRHFKINSAAEADDYAAMAELLGRYLSGAGDEFLPDLLLLDGGKGQLNIASEVVARLALAKPPELVSIAKGKEGEPDRLYRPAQKNPLSLAAHAPMLLLLMRIRDEAHRFGITFHRQLRQRNLLRSALDEIAGVGAKRKQALLRGLGSLKKITAATVDELAAVDGISSELAARIWHHFHE